MSFFESEQSMETNAGPAAEGDSRTARSNPDQCLTKVMLQLGDLEVAKIIARMASEECLQPLAVNEATVLSQ